MKLGELLLKLGLIKGRAVRAGHSYSAAATKVQTYRRDPRELGFISRTVLRDVLHRYRKHIHIGKLLVKMGAISETMLLRGLLLQQRSPDRLGKILVRTSEISQPVLADALSIQLTIPAIKPELWRMDRELLKEINANFLYTHRVVPVSRNVKEQVLTVIMEDPHDMETVSALEKIFKEKIEPAILVQGEINHILDSLLDPWAWANPLNNEPEKSNPFKNELLRSNSEPGHRSTWKIR